MSSLSLDWNAESVGVSWIRSLNTPGLTDASTTLPTRDRWTNVAYALVASAPARRPDNYDISRTPTLAIDVFAAPGTWGVVFTVADSIMDAARAFSPMTLTRNGFSDCLLRDVSVISAPIPLRRNDADNARMTMLIELVYFLDKEQQ